MRKRLELTLGQLFVWTTVATSVVAGSTFYAFLESSRRSIVERSDRLRDAEALRIGAKISSELGVAASALDDVAKSLRFGALSIDDRTAVEARLFSELLERPALSDLAVTRATLLGYDADGRARLAREGIFQVSVFRASADAASAIVTRRISNEGGRFVAEVRRRAPGARFLDAPLAREADAADPSTGLLDPTAHPTFATAVSMNWYGKAIWSDLSFSELDAARPAAERRVVVTVQQAVEDAPSRFAGVVRVGLLTQKIDELPRAESGPSQRVFLCDSEARLVARLEPSERLVSVGDDLRVQEDRLPAEIAAALAAPELRQVTDDTPERSARLVVGDSRSSGRSRSSSARYLATFRTLRNSQGWRVGVVVPEDYYTSDLRALRARFLVAIAVLTAIVLLSGGLLIGNLRWALGRVVAATTRMRAFDFAPAPVTTHLREVADVMEGLERAKTSMRALGKYVPIDLVRELYRSNREPELGGELVELSLLFSDIEGFTTLSEGLAPDALAQALGGYLAAMTAGVRSTAGTVDKFIGDSVMAFWNAPVRCDDHALRACRAVVACKRLTAELYASRAWAGLPPLFTRFGLHRATVTVGNFGAPERLNYTALGDGVNLASRLEGLCKTYHVSVLASEAIVQRASGEFAFRFLDRVTVKGKHECVRVHELLGERAGAKDALARAAVYEQALAAYFARDFARARSILGPLEDDPPSRVLAERCKAMIAEPPPPDWNGVYVATSK